MTAEPSLVHYVRIRRTEDLSFLAAGMCDELLLNANQLENSPERTSAHLRATGYRYMVDPMLWRFQVPAWWQNERGELKRNYRRLAAHYGDGTRVPLGEGPALETVTERSDWERIAANVVHYQRQRLNLQCQLDLLDESLARELRPSRILAPALVPDSEAVDRVNAILVEAAAAAAGERVVATVIIPRARLNPGGVEAILRSVPRFGVCGYFVWTPGATEDWVVATPDALPALVAAIRDLAAGGVPVIQVQLGYTAAALSTIGMAGVCHHLGWIDSGESPQQSRARRRSRRTYVPGVRRTMRFADAAGCGRQLDANAYSSVYCECSFCTGMLANGNDPLQLLLEEELEPSGAALVPTGRAVAANTFHYLFSRRREVQTFAAQPGTQVIARDIERAFELAGQEQAERLERLADRLIAA